MQSTIGKPAQEFSDFAAEARDTVKEFYRLNHAHQTLDFVLAKKADYLARNRKRLGVWEALEFLDTVVDDSDPDVDFTQIDHALQTAEAVRRAGQPRWLIATGLIHDLGKILCVFGEPQWAVVGDTFPVGCQFSSDVRLPGVLRRESRSRASGLLDARAESTSRTAGSTHIHMSWGHDEYIYHVVKDYLPRRGALRAALSLVLPVAQGRRLRSPRDRSGSRDAEVGEGIQPVRPATRRAMAGPTPGRCGRITKT